MKNRWLVFAGYLLLALGFYNKALQVYFLSDDWKLFYLLEQHGFSALAFNFESEFIRVIPCLLLSALYYLFGISSSLPFHLLSVGLHALNAFLVFAVAEKIFSRYLKNGSDSRFLYLFIAGSIFLALPYQAEAVTWMSGTSDLLACAFVLLSLIFYFDFKNSLKQKHLFLSVLFFLLAVLSKESSLFLPLMVFVLEITGQGRQLVSAIKTVTFYFVPVLIYAFLNKFLTGYFITPGVSILTNMPFALLMENYFLYAAKFFALYRLLPGEMKDILKLAMEYKAVALFALATAALVIYFFTKQKLSVKRTEIKLAAFCFVALVISLLPVIHLETSFIGSPQSDRYGYLPSVFFVIMLAALTMLVDKRPIVIAGACLFMVWFYVQVQEQNRNWIRAGNLVKEIVDKFHPPEGTTYVTNIPDNFNGAYVLRNGLAEAVSVIYHEDFLEKINMISFHTVTSEADRANVKLISDSVYSVTFARPERKISPAEKIFTIVPDISRYAYSDVSDTSFTVTIKALPSKSAFYFYSEGSLKVVP